MATKRQRVKTADIIVRTTPKLKRSRIGRTYSKRALGFIVSRGKARVDFVLDTDQVAELAAYLQIALPGLLKPLGRKPDQISLAALVPQPKRKPKRPR
jgi:hypothetical protein